MFVFVPKKILFQLKEENHIHVDPNIVHTIILNVLKDFYVNGAIK